MKILLGVTGSVAATLTPKLCCALAKIPYVEKINVVSTQRGIYFHEDLSDGWPTQKIGEMWTDEDEWFLAGNKVWEKKGDPVPHIDLRDSHSALVIAPLSANTLAKMATGICDNLLTSVYRAWDRYRPVIVAPAMNTYMWEHPITLKQVALLKEWGVRVLWTQKKQLVCGTEGYGAMANIDEIVAEVTESLRWNFPLQHVCCNGIPVGDHPGSFGYRRKYSHHTGVDLYCVEGATVYAVESGRILKVEHFTGPQDNSPWWNNTEAVLIEGASGVVCYGEIEPYLFVKPGYVVTAGEPIGKVIPVLPEGRERPDIPGHSRSMLHIELYDRSQRDFSTTWELDQPKHDYLLDPTDLLRNHRLFGNAIPILTTN